MTGESPLAKRYKKLRARVGSSDRSGPKSHVKFYAVLPEEISGRTTHYVGLPPALTGGDDQRQRMPGTRIMFLEELPEGGFLLVRFSSDGVFAGDTWHETASDLKDAAQWEFVQSKLDAGDQLAGAKLGLTSRTQAALFAVEHRLDPDR